MAIPVVTSMRGSQSIGNASSMDQAVALLSEAGIPCAAAVQRMVSIWTSDNVSVRRFAWVPVGDQA